MRLEMLHGFPSCLLLALSFIDFKAVVSFVFSSTMPLLMDGVCTPVCQRDCGFAGVQE